MGAYMSCAVPVVPAKAVKVLHPDGNVEEIRRTVTAAELMLENPLHLVCQWSPQSTKHQTLPADSELEMGRMYYLLPTAAMAMAKGGGAFSFPTQDAFSQTGPVASNLKRSSSLNDSKDSKDSKDSELLHSFFVKYEDSVTEVRISSNCLAKLFHHETVEECPSPDQDDDPAMDLAYTMRLAARSTSWRPKLATIEETVI